MNLDYFHFICKNDAHEDHDECGFVQYDIIKKMESVGKGTVGMVTGQGGPTIIQPSQYRKRFTTAMDRYFMTVPDKWISYET